MKKILLVIILGFLLQACSRMPTPNFQQMTLPKLPNYYLVCPQNYCNVAPSEYSPVYPVSAEDLFNSFNQIISQERLVNFVYSIPEQGQFELVARTKILNLPHDVSVQFIALSPTTSTLAIYSKSRYGVYDFGENKRRISNWLSQLSQMTTPPPVQAPQ